MNNKNIVDIPGIGKLDCSWSMAQDAIKSMKRKDIKKFVRKNKFKRFIVSIKNKFRK